MPSLRGALEDYWVHTIMDDGVRVELIDAVAKYKAYLVNPVFCLPSDMPHLPAKLMGGSADEGAMVDVWWHLDAQWYRGTISRYSPYTGVHTVTYEDGDVRDHNLPGFGEGCKLLPMVPMSESEAYLATHGGARAPLPPTSPPSSAAADGGAADGAPPLPAAATLSIDGAPAALVRCQSLDAAEGGAADDEVSVLLCNILRESCSQFDSLPLTSLTIPLDQGDEADAPAPVAIVAKPYPPGTMMLGKFNNGKWYPGIVTTAGHDAASKTYAVMFEDGDVHPRFRECDVKQDLGCPVEGDSVAVVKPGSWNKADERVMTFVRRSADGAVELRDPANADAMVVLATASELKTLRRLKKDPVVPKVRLRSIPSWAETAASMPAATSALKVRLSSFLLFVAILCFFAAILLLFGRSRARHLFFMYRYIPRESCSQFDSLPLTSLTIARGARHSVQNCHRQVGHSSNDGEDRRSAKRRAAPHRDARSGRQGWDLLDPRRRRAANGDDLGDQSRRRDGEGRRSGHHGRPQGGRPVDDSARVRRPGRRPPVRSRYVRRDGGGGEGACHSASPLFSDILFVSLYFFFVSLSTLLFGEGARRGDCHRGPRYRVHADGARIYVRRAVSAASRLPDLFC